MSPVEYQVSCRNPHAVEVDLCRLWRENLGLATSPEERFQWLYRDAPDAADMVFVLEAVANGTTSVVGANGVAVRRFWVAGREARAAVSCDLAVDRAHRSLLPALCLVRAFRADGAARFDFVCGFPNGKAEGVLKRAGFRELGRARRWAKVLRHARYTKRLGSRHDVPTVVRLASSLPWVLRVGATTFDFLAAAAANLGAASVAMKHHVRSQAAPDERWDALWRDARDEYDVVGARTSEFLRWRFPPALGTRFVTLQRRGDDRLRAYAVVQFADSTGALHVRDLFGHHADLGTLVDALVPLAYRSGASSLSLSFLGAPTVERLLVERRFTRREDDRCVVIEVGSALAAHAAAVTDASRWHLFDVDEDA